MQLEDPKTHLHVSLRKLDDLLILAEQRLDILRATLLAHDLFATSVEDVETILDQVRGELGI